ncbi:fluoride efflux transporter CrcB [uncultured Nocardioides sp.]|uniref:fluoride efflux transporter CrcB n=1 Tax=uncultured Nocardioides sp. TaxID=198441 RepID=UPI00260C5085|nr:fluoride efflux transporter CrcB [uncultured Nocardioides sp.]
MTVLMVLVGGAVGAPLRYLTDLLVQARHDSVFPWGTFTVNVLGSLVLGVAAGSVVALSPPSWVLALVGTGLCGAFTTFSTFGFETIRLIEEGSWSIALVNSVASLAVGLGVCAGAYAAAVAVLG